MICLHLLIAAGTESPNRELNFRSLSTINRGRLGGLEFGMHSASLSFISVRTRSSVETLPHDLDPFLDSILSLAVCVNQSSDVHPAFDNQAISSRLRK